MCNILLYMQLYKLHAVVSYGCFVIEKDMDSYKAVVKFSKDASINAAYNKMTSNIAVILETKNVNFNILRRACIQEIHALGSTIPKNLMHKIQPTKSLNELLDVLALSPYWNWFDTRLLQALVSASGSPEAEEWLENFKATFYAKKVTEVIPYVSIKPFKESTKIVEKFDKDPKDLTISELLEHKYKLEYEVLDIDEGELVLSCIKTGCVELTWQIPQELIYRAYTSMKRKHDDLLSLAVKSLVCEATERYAGLPILWRGQEVGEIGPIEPLPEHVRQEPYSLPQGFQWVTLSSNNVDKVVKFFNKHSMISNTSFQYKDMFNYHLTYPNSKGEWQFGIQAPGGKLVGIVMGIPAHIYIGKESKIFINALIGCHRKYMNKRLTYVLSKELQRRSSLTKINQLLLPSNLLFKPVSTTVYWGHIFDQFTSDLLPSSPRTPGWRRMASEDVPSVLALINKWSSQFEIRQVFGSEEELSYNFLQQKYVFSYVVEDKSNKVTDFVSYMLFDVPLAQANITAVVSTQSPVKQLIIDALVCARENGARGAIIVQFNIESNLLASLSFQPYQYGTFHFYNYRYHEIARTNFWILTR